MGCYGIIAPIFFREADVAGLDMGPIAAAKVPLVAGGRLRWTGSSTPSVFLLYPCAVIDPRIMASPSRG